MRINPGVALVEPDFKMTFVAPCRCCRFDRLLCRMRLEKLAWRGETQIFVRRFANEEFEKARSFEPPVTDRKSTRLNSSHRCISYAVFCLKKKKKNKKQTSTKNI